MNEDVAFGTWDMVHDDWRGTLILNGGAPAFETVDGDCHYHYRPVVGTWTGTDGTAKPVQGVVQGADKNSHVDAPCKFSSHLVQFTIDFANGEPPQEFEGYVFTHQARTMAGYTWWHGIPFGWFATKR